MKSYFLALAALAAANASACSFPVASVDQQVDSAEEIFIATLLEARVLPRSSDRRWPAIEGRFQVAKTLKGKAQPKEITLLTGMGRGDCGVAMLVSAKYIIFKGAKDTGVGEETGTRVIEDFQEDEISAKIKKIVNQRRERQKR